MKLPDYCVDLLAYRARLRAHGHGPFDFGNLKVEPSKRMRMVVRFFADFDGLSPAFAVNGGQGS